MIRRFVVLASVFLVPGALWGQGWLATGCSPTGSYCLTSGNAGIGTNNPGNTLTVGAASGEQVQGTTPIAVINGPNKTTFNGGILAIYTTDTATADYGGSIGFGGNYVDAVYGIDFGTIAGRLAPGTIDGGYLAFSTRASSGNMNEQMRITSIGQVGIGTSNPADVLEVHNGTENNVRFVNASAFGSGYTGIGLQGINDAASLLAPLSLAGSAVLFPQGNVGIGTSAPPYPLSVKGTIGAQEVIITNTSGWADYIFQPDYRLASLSDVAAFVRENHHLPDMPSAAEVQEKGVSVGEMQAKLLAKIEELTLHMIEAEKDNRDLRVQNRELGERITKLERGAVSQ